MSAGRGLLERTVEVASRAVKMIADEVEKVIGRPVKVKERAEVRAGMASRMVEPLLQQSEDGVIPFPAARTRAVLHVVKARVGDKQLKGAR